MRRRHGRVNRWVLVALAVVALLVWVLVARSVRPVRSRDYEPRRASAELSARAFAQVRALRERLGAPIDSVNDPNATGLIGLQFSQVTFGRSDLSDALTATNPNFAAALVDLLGRAGARRGDTIGVSWDGTYPALNVGVLAAAQVMGLWPVVVTAQSAGMWGANEPGMSWLEIEQELRRAGLWVFRSAAATLGGETDDGRGLSPAGRALLTLAAESSGVPLFVPESLAAGVALRESVFGRARVLVSVGAVAANSGETPVRSGLHAGRGGRDRHGGLVGSFRRRGLPVVHIGDASRVAVDNRLPVAPMPLPEIGRGRLFFERRYSVLLAGLGALLLLGLTLLVVRYDVESYFGVKRPEGDKEAV